MRIGIDCTTFDSGYVGGINTYLFGVLGSFLSHPRQHSFVVFCAPESYAAFAPLVERGPLQIVQGVRRIDPISRLQRAAIALLLRNQRLWKAAVNAGMQDISRKINENCDFLYCPLTFLSCYDSKVPTLVSMHDIQHVHHPEFFSWSDLRKRVMHFDATADAASYIQVSSEFIRDDIVRHYTQVGQDRIVVIPEGVDLAAFRQEKVIDVRAKYGLPERFLFLPAQLWKHKNHITLLKALAILKHEYKMAVPLVMTGGKFSAYDKIMSFIAQNELTDVHYMGKVPFADIVGLYRQAWFLAMPTLHESSSLPVLEAMASGLPVLASDIPPIREMARRFALNLFEPLNAGAIVKCIHECWDNTALRDEQIATNSVAVEASSWDAIANSYLDFLESKIDTAKMKAARVC